MELASLLLVVATFGQALTSGGTGGGEIAQLLPAASEPVYRDGFANLHEQIGDVMGDPLENAHPGKGGAQAVQATTAGLAYYYPGAAPAFTNGYRTWYLDGPAQGTSPDDLVAAVVSAAKPAEPVAGAADQPDRPMTTGPPSSVWTRLAACEASGNWATNTGNGYSGGLQFDAATWRRYGGLDYAAAAYLATPNQQILIAQRTQSSQGWSAWPVCSRKLGLR